MKKCIGLYLVKQRWPSMTQTWLNAADFTGNNSKV